jgi:hypothetical protein
MSELALRLVDMSPDASPQLEALCDPVRLVHALPGRVRYHLPSWDGSRALDLEAAMLSAPGVVAAEASPVTRNILVYFDLDECGEADIRRAVNPLAGGAPRVIDASAGDRSGSRSTAGRPSSQHATIGASSCRKRLEVVLGARAATLLPHMPKLLSLTLSFFTPSTPVRLTMLSLDWLDLLTRLTSEPA